MERHTAGPRHYVPTRAERPRNGMPPRKPYVWAGDGTGMTEAEVQERIAAIRAQVTERPGAIDDAMPPFAPFTPGPEWYRELADTDVPGVAALAAVLDAQAPEVPAPRPATRCRKCGYLRSRCGGRCAR